MLRTILALTFIISARASTAPEVVASIDPHSIENEAIANFIDWMSHGLEPERSEALTPRVREAVRARVLGAQSPTAGSVFATTPLARRIDALGVDMGELLVRADLTARQRVQGALDIFTELTVALVNDAGQRPSRWGAILAGAAALEAVAAGLYGLDHGALALVAASLGAVPAAASLLPETNRRAAPHAERLRMARAHVERFWSKAEERWRDDGARTVPAGTSFVDHANDILNLEEAEFTDACAEWLAKDESATQVPARAG